MTMVKPLKILQPVYDQGFLDRCVGLFLGMESGHMGADMYQHHDSQHDGQSMSGVFTWDMHAKYGTIPQQERGAFSSRMDEIVKLLDYGIPIVAFGPTAEVSQLVARVNSRAYVPVDNCPKLLEREKALAAKVRPENFDFFSDEVRPLIDAPALGVLVGLTISNIPGPPPYIEPKNILTHTLRRFASTMPHGGNFLVSVDTNQNKNDVIQLYSEKWHKLFGVNFLYRMVSELPISGLNPDLFEYHPVWHEHCGLLAHTVRATASQDFILRTDSYPVRISVKQGDIFHYNNSFKYRRALFEECAAKADLKIEKVWEDSGSIKLYLFQLPLL